MTGTPRWSPDGRRIAFDSRVNGQGEIFLVGSDGGAPQQLTYDPAEDIVPSWSADGKRVYFASRRTGVFEVWAAPSTGGPAVRITRGGGFGPRESPDGRLLYYVRSREEPVLFRMPAAGGSETRIAGLLHNWSTYVPTRDGVVAALRSESAAELRLFPQGRLIHTFRGPLHYGFSLSPDGRSLIYTTIDNEEGDLLYVDLPPAP